jgi:hypothetical protein
LFTRAVTFGRGGTVVLRFARLTALLFSLKSFHAVTGLRPLTAFGWTSRGVTPALAGGRAEAEGERVELFEHRPSFRSETSRQDERYQGRASRARAA